MTTSLNILNFNLPRQDENWGKIIPLRDSKAEELPIDIFPYPFKDFIQSISDTIEISQSAVIFSVLGALSTALQGKFKVSVDSNYSEPLNLYLLISLPPAEGKSPTLKYCMKPIVDFEIYETNRLEDKYRIEKSEYESALKAIENARKNLNVNSTKDEWKAINNMELNLKPPKALPELILTDVTSESLLTSLKEQENKISIISDEGGVLDVIGGLYNNGRSNIDVVLKGWDGGRIHVRRSNQNYTLTPIITFCLAVQPDFLEKISKNNTFNGRGFFERFLYCIPEQRTTPKMYLNKTVPQQIISDYNDKITELLKLPYNPNEPTYLTLSSDADCVWRNFRRDMSRNSINNGKFSICDKWAGKLGSQVLRIAGLLHLAKVGLTSTSIDDITMLDAIIFANKLTSHSIKMFEQHFSVCSDDITDAEKVLSAIASLKDERIYQSDLTYALRNKLKSNRIKQILSLLLERNYICDPIQLPTGRSISFKVNPEFWEIYNPKSSQKDEIIQF